MTMGGQVYSGNSSEECHPLWWEVMVVGVAWPLSSTRKLGSSTHFTSSLFLSVQSGTSALGMVFHPHSVWAFLSVKPPETPLQTFSSGVLSRRV